MFDCALPFMHIGAFTRVATALFICNNISLLCSRKCSDTCICIAAGDPQHCGHPKPRNEKGKAGSTALVIFLFALFYLPNLLQNEVSQFTFAWSLVAHHLWNPNRSALLKGNCPDYLNLSGPRTASKRYDDITFAIAMPGNATRAHDPSAYKFKREGMQSIPALMQKTRELVREPSQALSLPLRNRCLEFSNVLPPMGN